MGKPSGFGEDRYEFTATGMLTMFSGQLAPCRQRHASDAAEVHVVALAIGLDAEDPMFPNSGANMKVETPTVAMGIAAWCGKGSNAFDG